MNREAFLQRHRALGREDMAPTQRERRDSRGSEPVTVSGEIKDYNVHPATKALTSILFSDGTRSIQMPGRFVKFTDGGDVHLGPREIEIPMWLAKDRGLV